MTSPPASTHRDGRATYEIRARHEQWPHPEPHLFITSRPLIKPAAAGRIRRANSPPLPTNSTSAAVGRSASKRCQLIRGLIDIGRLDVWRWRSSGVLGEDPTLPRAPRTELRLVKCELKSGGALHVVYEGAVSRNVAPIARNRLILPTLNQ